MSQGRQEHKFVVPVYQMDALRSAISPHVIADNHKALQDSNRYAVRSIYFDTFDLKDFYEKESGLQLRKKLRVRGYAAGCDKAEVFLEIKWKRDNLISKDRVPVPYNQLAPLLATGNVDTIIHPRSDFPKGMEHATRFLFHLKRSHRVPVNLVTYTREAYVGKFNHSDRITFDSNIRSLMFPGLEDLYEDARLVPFLTREFVLEYKSEHPTPRWFQDIVQRFSLNKQAYSKYVEGITAHYHPETACSRQEVIAFGHY